MDNNSITKYGAFLDSKSSCRLPRWEELPSLELYMDQVVTLMNGYISGFSPDGEGQITPSMINNYVKHSIIPVPVKKKYNRVHLSRLVIICALKSVLPISAIAEMIDRLLMNKSDQQLHDFFAEHYEKTFSNIVALMRDYTEKTVTDGDFDEMLSLTALHGASIACAGKFLAANVIREQEKRLLGIDNL